MNVVACKIVWFHVERSTSTHCFSSLQMAKMFKTCSTEAVLQSYLSQRRQILRRQIHAHGLLRKTGRPQHSVTRIKSRDLVRHTPYVTISCLYKLPRRFLAASPELSELRSRRYRQSSRAGIRCLQGLGVCRAQKQSEVEASTPVAYLLDYAASLGITKDITKTQAYSVWLQGVRTQIWQYIILNA